MRARSSSTLSGGRKVAARAGKLAATRRSVATAIERMLNHPSAASACK
jgi:hypothetical protein